MIYRTIPHRPIYNVVQTLLVHPHSSPLHLSLDASPRHLAPQPIDKRSGMPFSPVPTVSYVYCHWRSWQTIPQMKEIKNTIRVNSNRTVRRSRIHSLSRSRIYVHILLIHQIHCINLIAVLSPRLHNVVRHVTCRRRIFPLVRNLTNSMKRHFPGLSSVQDVGAAVVNGSDAVVIGGVFFRSVTRGLLIFSVVGAGLHCGSCFGTEPGLHTEFLGRRSHTSLPAHIWWNGF
jgi:hypothetical protein